MSASGQAGRRARVVFCVLAAVFLTLGLAGCDDKKSRAAAEAAAAAAAAAMAGETPYDPFPDVEPDADGYITDPRDGMRYRTVKTGGLAWMAENLKYATPECSDGYGCWCFDNNHDNCIKYGLLYSWYVATREACPPGWRVPSISDWDNLFVAAGGSFDAENHRWNAAGAKLKAKTGWKDKGNGTDNTGFSALPGGFREGHDGGEFKFAGAGGYWWASDEKRGGSYRAMGWDMSHVNENRVQTHYGFSVRCVRGDVDPPAPGAGRRPVPAAPEINAAVTAGTPDTRWYRRGAKSFTISTADQLAGLAELVNDGNKFEGMAFVLDGDIDLSAYGRGSTFNGGKGWIPIGVVSDKPFGGVFDGGGKKIRGLYINDPELGAAGLFGTVHGQSAMVENLGVMGVDITGGNQVGGIAGFVNDGGRVSGCRSTGAVNGIDLVGGVVGLVGYNSYLYGSHSAAAVTGEQGVGGVVGYAGASVSGCHSTGAVRGATDVGGVAGTVYGQLSGSYSTGAVSGRAGRVGGVAGRVHGGWVTGCYSTGAVSGREGTGGVAGSAVYGSRLSGNAALNPSVKGVGESTGRVVGYVHSAEADHILNNAAFTGLKDKDGKTGRWTVKGEDAMDGADITAEDLTESPSINNRFTDTGGEGEGTIWTIEAGKLPGLGGKAVEMPEHLRR